MGGGDVIDRLFAEHDAIATYPEGVVPVRGRLRGLGFFPGGRGLFPRDDGSFPPLRPGGVLVLGHNLDSEAGFQRSLRRGEESRKGSTWRALIELLQRAEVPIERCFFTNAYLGLKGRGGATGEFPGRQSRPFVEACRRFLFIQIQSVQPRVIATLGNWVPEMLAPLSPALQAWCGVKRVADLDERHAALVPDASFEGVEGEVAVVALTHPDRRRLNVHRRRWRGLEGAEAERRMLVEAWSRRPDPR